MRGLVCALRGRGAGCGRPGPCTLRIFCSCLAPPAQHESPAAPRRLARMQGRGLLCGYVLPASTAGCASDAMSPSIRWRYPPGCFEGPRRGQGQGGALVAGFEGVRGWRNTPEIRPLFRGWFQIQYIPFRTFCTAPFGQFHPKNEIFSVRAERKTPLPSSTRHGDVCAVPAQHADQSRARGGALERGVGDGHQVAVRV